MRKSVAAALAIALGLVLVRAAPWVLWEQAHFDSDQAIGGLMALHLAEGRAFPLVHYGQYYMLGVDTWLAAPLFRLFGPSVTMLKLPLVAINIVVVVLLIRLLQRDAGLSPPLALVASLFVVMPPPVTSSRLVEVQATNIEVFLYTLLLWIARDRPWIAGAIAGFGLMHREFTIYPIVAIAIVSLVDARRERRAPAEGRATGARGVSRADVLAAVGSALVVMIAIELLKTRADLLGPGTAGTYLVNILRAHVDQSVGSRICWNPSALVPNVQWLVTHNLGTLFGWRAGPLSQFNLATRVVAGHAIAAVAVATIGIAVAVAGARPHRSVPAAFSIYLMLVGAQAVAVYTLFSCTVRDEMLVRYTLLGLLVPVGAVAFVFERSRSGALAAITASAVLVWAAASGVDDARVLAEYMKSPPRDEYREFAQFLESQRVRYAMAPFWTAYHIDFLTNERVIVGTWERVAIAEYQDIVREQGGQAARITFDEPCAAGAMAYRRWCVLR